MDPIIDRPEIAFFDVETTVPTRHGQGFALLEFGAILVCPKKLEELESYSTLVRPSDLSLISSLSVRCNGITPEAVSDAPSFRDISDRVYNILHGRIWAGHNILRFDCARIREAYAEINKPAPEPKGAIDTLALLTQKFGRRAGDMKMATLASYFGLGKQTHRSLDDVRMNLEVVKYCATVLFLESSLPDIFTTNSWVSPNSTTRSRSNGKAPQEGTSANRMMPSSTLKFENNSMLSSATQRAGETYSILSPTTCIRGEQVQDFVQSKAPRLEPFDMGSLSNEIKSESLQPDITMEENPVPESTTISSAPLVSEGYADYVEPDEISIPYVNASFVPFYRGSQRMKISHKDVPLKLCCPYLKVRFGISTKFADHAGRPRLSFVVDTSPSLCRVLDACDNIAQRLSVDSGSSSEWKPVVIRKNGFLNSPTARVHIPTVINGDIAIYATEIYQKETSGNVQRLVFSRFDAAELDSLFVAGTYIDACFSLDPYDYQQNAGIRLVAKSLTIHSN